MGQAGRVRVVIVDDQPIFRHAARHCLEARGYDVVADARSLSSPVRHFVSVFSERPPWLSWAG